MLNKFIKVIESVYNKFSFWILGALLGSIVVSGVGWRITSLKLDAERKAHKLTIEGYKSQQKTYEVEAYKNKIEVEKKYNEIATKADETADDLRAKYNASVLRYQASRSQVRDDHLPLSTNTPESSDGGGKGAYVSEDDLLVCAENQARLEAAHEWAKSLVKE